MSFVVYGKSPKCKRFSPIGKTGMVISLIHAIMFNSKEAADKDCESLKKANPDWQFEVRKK